MFEDIFQRKKCNAAKLREFGFTRQGERWKYEIPLADGNFCLSVTITGSGAVDTDLIELETGEPYVLYKTGAVGAYVGKIRSAVTSVLEEIAEKCYETAVFQTRQADMLTRYIRDTYEDELEFLWAKFPDIAIWRRKERQKWYGVIGVVSGKKIGLASEKPVEIIVLRMDPAQKAEKLSQKGYYPGWHMNKNHWYTVVLDSGVSDEELKTRIAESYALAK